MKESRQEHRRERLRRNLSALKGSKESPINGEQKRTAHKRNRKAMRKSSKGRSPRGSSPSGRETKKRAYITLKETVRIGHVIIGIFPHVEITTQNWDANSVKCALSCAERLTVHLTEDRKRMVVTVLLLCWKNPGN